MDAATLLDFERNHRKNATTNTPLSSVTVIGLRNNDGTVSFVFGTGHIFTSSPDGAIVMTQDATISPDPTDDDILEYAIMQAQFHVRTLQTDTASLTALAHMRGEYIQQYLKLNYGTGNDFNMPSIPGLGAQPAETRQAFVNDFNNSQWRINDAAGQAGGPGNVSRAPDGTITANVTAAGFEGYWSLGDTGTNYYFLHELSHVSPAGAIAENYFAQQYLNNTGTADFSQYGPNFAEFKNNEVYANWIAKGYADGLGVNIIGNPGYGYSYY